MLDLEDLTVDQLNSIKEGKELDLEDLNIDQLNKIKQLQYQQQQKQDPFGFGPPGSSQLDITNPFGKDDTIDLTSGVRNYDFRSNFAEQDNEEERVEYLRRKVGKAEERNGCQLAGQRRNMVPGGGIYGRDETGQNLQRQLLGPVLPL